MLLVALSVRIPFVFVIPMVEAPDEFAHYWVTKFIAENLRLPAAPEVALGGPSAVYGSLPVLGYLPHILVARMFPLADISLVERFGSVLMGILLVYISILLGRELFPERKLLALAQPVIVAFHPQLVFVNAYCNNDSTTSALCAAVLLLLIYCLKRGPKMIYAVVIGCLLGVTALSKYSGLAVAPTAVVAVGLALWLHKASARQIMSFAAVGFVSAALSCGWWFWRSYGEFGGDLTGTKTMRATWAATYKRPETFIAPWPILRQRQWWNQLFTSFWAVFGYQSRYLWPPVYAAYLFFLAIAALTPLFSLSKRLRAGSAGSAPSKKELESISIWASLMLFVFFNFVSLIAASCFNLGGPQGRYLFASEAAIIALIVAGLGQLKGRLADAAVLLFALFNIVVCIGSFVFLHQLFGFTTRLY